MVHHAMPDFQKKRYKQKDNTIMEIIQGTLDRIFFEKEGYLIGVFLSDSNTIAGVDDPFTSNSFTAKGNLANPQYGMVYDLQGKWINNQYKGNTTQQFQFESARVAVPADEKGIYRYLVKQCKYVGPTIGNRILDEYGEQSLDVLKNDPQRVADEISGLTLAKTESISAMLQENEDQEKAMVDIEALLGGIEGMLKNIGVKLIDKYGIGAVDKIMENPYVLTEIKGIGFHLADKVAMEAVKIAPDSIYRKQAAVIHAMGENSNQGHVWAERETIDMQALVLTNSPGNDEAIDGLIDKGVLTGADEDNNKIANKKAAENERYSALRLAGLCL